MKYCIGLDMGGTSLKIGIVSSKGEIKDTHQVHTLAETNSLDMIFRNMVSAVQDLISRNPDIKIEAIGIGSPGAISPEEGRIVTGINNIPPLNGFALAVEIGKAFSLPCFIDNDANNAGRGEFLFGAGQGMKNFVMITLGTGIGGAIFIDGNLYPGVLNYSGEVGHMIIIMNGKPCTCGNFGCWEAYGSATAMVKMARALIEKGLETKLIGYYPDELNAKAIVDEAQNGDRIAHDIVIQTGKYVGVGIANLINIFNPEAVIVGGGLSLAGEILFNEITHHAKLNSQPRAFSKVQITQAILGNNAGILGSAALAFMNIK